MQQPGIPRVRAVKRDASAAPLDPSMSMIVHGTLMYLNLIFYELILQDRHPNTISKLSAKYQFCPISTADTRDGKLTTRGVYSWVVHRLSTVCPPFIPARVTRLCFLQQGRSSGLPSLLTFRVDYLFFTTSTRLPVFFITSTRFWDSKWRNSRLCGKCWRGTSKQLRL